MFKVGDKIKCVDHPALSDPSPELIIGNIYTVLDYSLPEYKNYLHMVEIDELVKGEYVLILGEDNKISPWVNIRFESYVTGIDYFAITKELAGG